MVCTYRVKTDTAHDEKNRAHTVYGIEAVDSDGSILLSFSDIFFDRQKAEGFACLCNSGGLSLIHFPYVVEDVLAE